MRADIQFLRALAVSLVVVYHFWPWRLTGGFVGVDVFFVISGYLITAHLLTNPPSSLASLGEFWARRVRRLLPASFVVILVTLVASVCVAPTTMWANIAKQASASALYVQNWFLASESLDYLAADTAATPFQHFWSLSVEEQFYLVWPILLLVALGIAARLSRPNARVAATVAILLVAVSSFIASVILTPFDPSTAYFVTWTRLWELSVGALLATGHPLIQKMLGRRASTRMLVALLGTLMVGISAISYSASTVFPGSAALLPVVGTALVIAAEVEENRAVMRPISWAPVRLLGDISYSLYLWHWPAVVLLPLALGHELRWYQKALTIVALIGLAWATKILVEDRFRGRRAFGAHVRGSFVFMAAGIAVVLVASTLVSIGVGRAAAAAAIAVEHQLASDQACFGGQALVGPTECPPHGEELLTDPAFAADDKPDPYQDGCWILGNFDDQKTCEYGTDVPGASNVALIGNSHAGHWLPALQEISAASAWQITTFLISECYTVDSTIEFETSERTQNCSDWNERAISEIENGDYDLVVISNRTFRPLAGIPEGEQLVAAQSAYTRVLQRWAAADIPVLVLRDTPYATELSNVPDCVAKHLDDLSTCDGNLERQGPDPLADAARELAIPGVDVLDLTDRICSDGVCYSVVGGVIVYFDTGHLSATFARSLAPDVFAAANRLLAGAA